jgi:hypothetical protein
MSEFRELLVAICRRPAMYVGRNSLVDVSIYLSGYFDGLSAAGSSVSPMDGFMRWTEMRFGIFHSAWHWTRILLHEFGSDQACFEVLPTLYDEFVLDRERLGLDGIERETKRRLQERHGQDWWEPESTTTKPNYDR